MSVLVDSPRVHVDAGPQQVWDVLTDFAAWSDWSPTFDVRGDAVSRGARLTIHARVVPGPPLVLPCRIQRAEPGRALSWTGGIPGLLRVEHAFELTAERGGTLVHHWERFTGPLSLAMAPLRTTVEREYAAINTRLAMRVESLPAR